jgi:hypothetical protein
VADAICAELERAGIRCWIAPRDITPGRMWGEAIIDGINASRVMILIHSKQSNKSPQVIREVERAVNRRLLLLQLRMADIKPSRALEFYLASSQWLDAFPGPIDAHLQSLPRLVRNLLAEAVRTGEHSAEYSAEHQTKPPTEDAAVQQTAAPAPLDAPRAPTDDARPLVVAPGPSEPPAVVPSQREKVLVTDDRVSRRRRTGCGAHRHLGNNAVDQGRPGADHTRYSFRQFRRYFARRLQRYCSKECGKEYGTECAAYEGSTGCLEPCSTALRIAAMSTTYKVGDRISLQVEPKSTMSLRWRSGNSRIVAWSPGDLVFQAKQPGNVYLYAESGGQRDSVRVRVIESPRVADNTPQQSQSPPVTVPNPVVGKDTTGVIPSRETAKLPALTDALAATKAGDCVQAIMQHKADWLRAHYGSSLTVGDAQNLKNLETMFGKRGYRADLLNAAKFAGNVVTFSMQVSYQGGFGPRLSVDIPFEVRMAGDQPQAALETCRVRGALKAP